VCISVSVGICTSPEQGSDSERLMQCADAAMYRAKANGRNRYQVSGDGSPATLVSR
jgi:diguanylate cyclase (GGDEF)-like protein